MRVIAFTKYGRAAASTRQRVLQYRPALLASGISVDTRALLDDDYMESLVKGTRFPRRRVAGSYARRLAQLRTLRNYDAIWVYAELFPHLPGQFEKLAFAAGKPVVYDFDDAFFHKYEDHPRPLARKLLTGKLEPLLSGAAVCCCGNSYLQDYAQRFCARSVVLPTTVDTDIYRAVPRGDCKPVIGWIGSPSTWHNVRPILPVLRALADAGAARIRIVGAGTEAERDQYPGLEFVTWSEDSEVAEVQKMDIGIMPLIDHPFERGKSGYKLIQYMACGLPVVASPVGVNADIVEHGANGYLARNLEDWRTDLLRLLGDAELRRAMGERGRDRAEADYSLRSQAPRLIEIFRSLR
jgi:glycosyltransferase involved in cell wall biosynthesis